MSPFVPVYQRTLVSGQMKDRVVKARKLLDDCRLCPRQCRVNRTKNELGFCRTGKQAWVSSYGPHFGEERPLVGKNGSGTIFFTHCNLRCNFCQNYDISHLGHGQEVTDAQLAQIMLTLQRRGCHNINLVTPSHVIPQIIAAVGLAAEKGLELPIVYNTGGYDRVDSLRLLEAIVDIYMPDFKFWDAEIARDTCQAADYPEIARRAIRQMHRQVGDLRQNTEEIATRGLLVRHLLMPGGLAGSGDIFRFIATAISPQTYVNIMPQYRPCGRAAEIPALAEGIDAQTYRNALNAAREAGLERLDPPRWVFRGFDGSG
jgi:putative pyruvate formate lyase activating enzyme